MLLNRKLFLSVAIAATFPVVPSVGLAQMALEEIIVTARKKEESIQDIPVAVTAITAESFERSTIVNFDEVSKLAPGFSVAPSTVSATAPVLSMRGSVQNDVVITNDPSVGIYVDDVYFARPYGVGMDLLDLQGVQVLKGPQGTLFGRNSTSGALLLTTNDPSLEESSTSLSVTAGPEVSSYQTVINLPLVDTLALRLAYQKYDRDDYIDNVPNNPDDPVYNQLEGNVQYAPANTAYDKIGGRGNETLRAKLLWAPTDDLEVVLGREDFDMDYAGPARDQVWVGGIGVDQPQDDDEVSLSFSPRSVAETETNTLTVRYNMDVGDLKFIASNREYRSYNESDFDGGDWAAAPAFGGLSIRRHGSWGRTFGEQDSFELQYVTGLFDDAVQLTTGVNHFTEDATYYDYSKGTDPYLTGAGAPAGMVQQDVAAMGAYAQAVWALTDISNLTFGLRRSIEEKEVSVWGPGVAALPSWDVNDFVTIQHIISKNHQKPLDRFFSDFP